MLYIPTLIRGTRLTNKRSGKVVSVIDIFNTLNEKTKWQTMKCYRCLRLNGGYERKYIYILESELDKWSLNAPPSYSN